jgi:hypothetical protein
MCWALLILTGALIAFIFFIADLVKELKRISGIIEDDATWHNLEG